MSNPSQMFQLFWLWRDRETDPPPIPEEGTEKQHPILVVEEGIVDGELWQTPVVLYWFVREQDWIDSHLEPRDWTLWQPIALPDTIVRAG